MSCHCVSLLRTILSALTRPGEDIKAARGHRGRTRLIIGRNRLCLIDRGNRSVTHSTTRHRLNVKSTFARPMNSTPLYFGLGGATLREAHHARPLEAARITQCARSHGARSCATCQFFERIRRNYRSKHARKERCDQREGPMIARCARYTQARRAWMEANRSLPSQTHRQQKHRHTNRTSFPAYRAGSKTCTATADLRHSRAYAPARGRADAAPNRACRETNSARRARRRTRGGILVGRAAPGRWAPKKEKLKRRRQRRRRKMR